MIAAGNLTQRVTIQRPDQTTSPTGQRLPGWSDVATVWAGVSQTAATESETAERVGHHTQYVVTIYRLDSVDSSCRVVLESGDVLHIDGIETRHHLDDWMQLVCREVS